MNQSRNTGEACVTDMHHRFFTELQGLAEVGSFDWNIKTNELRWSNELYRIYGLDPSIKMTLDKFVSLIHPDDREKVQRGIADAISGNGRLHQEERILRSDGEILLLESRGLVTRDDAGNPTHFIGVCRDITAQRDTEIALQWQLDGLELLAETSYELLAYSRSPREWNTFLDRFTQHLGFDVHSLWCWEDPPVCNLSLGGELRELSESLANSNSLVKSMIAQSELWTYQVLGKEDLTRILGSDDPMVDQLKIIIEIPFTKDGSVIGALAFGSTTRSNVSKSELNFAFAVRDLLRSAKIRIYADEERRVSEERYRLVTENAKMIIWEKRPNSSDFDYVNGSCEELLGYPAEKWLEKSFWESRLHPEDRQTAVEVWQRIIKDQRSERVEYRMIGSDGRVVWVDDVTTIVHDRNGKMIGRRGSLQDITERKNLENRNVQSQKMEAIGNLAGGIAHDFNNLLTAILSNLEIASLNPGDAVSAVETAKNATQSAASIVRHLLRFSKKSKLELRPISCNGIVSSAIALLNHALDATIHIELCLNEDLPLIMADHAGIEQVIVNLCLNARDAMPSGGTIRIKTELRSAQEKQFVLLSVTDSGIGMSDNVRNRVFEPFFTTKEVDHGTGLGLSTCYAIVKQHDGNIECSSQQGSGTEFRVWLPIAGDLLSCQTSTPKSFESQREINSEHILVVDDEEVVLRATSSLLKCMGYSTLEARSGDEALQILNNDELNTQVRAVLLDLTMPHRNGKEILQCIKTSFPNLPVLICSGYVCENVDFEGLIHPDGFVHKPYSLQQLRESLTRACSRSTSG